MLDAPRLGRFAFVEVIIFSLYDLRFPSQPRNGDRRPRGRESFSREEGQIVGLALFPLTSRRDSVCDDVFIVKHGVEVVMTKLFAFRSVFRGDGAASPT